MGTLLSSWEIVSGLGVSEVGEKLVCTDLRENLPPEKLPPSRMSFTLQVAQILIGLIMLCLGVTISLFSPFDYRLYSVVTTAGYHIWGSFSVSISDCFSICNFSGTCNTFNPSLSKIHTLLCRSQARADCLGSKEDVVRTGGQGQALSGFSLFGQFLTSGALSIAAGRKVTRCLVSVSPVRLRSV